MSIWSKIGLADQEMMQTLLHEIQCLRAENTQLLEKNQVELRDTQAKLKGEVEKIAEKQEQASRKIEKMEEALFNLTSVLNKQKEDMETQLTAIQSIKKDIQDEACSERSALTDRLNEIAAALGKNFESQASSLNTLQIHVGSIQQQQTDALAQNDRQGAMILAEIHDSDAAREQLKDALEALGVQTKSIQDICRDVPAIHEELHHLWEATKLVWVDSVLNDYKNFLSETSK